MQVTYKLRAPSTMFGDRNAFEHSRLAAVRFASWANLNIVNEYRRFCFLVKESCIIASEDAIDALAELFAMHGVPKRIRSDNGPEHNSSAIKKWLSSLGIEVLYIEPGSPWQNGVCESFNNQFQDKYLSQTELVNKNDARLKARARKYDFNEQRPHSSHGYLTPLEFARRCGASSPLAALATPNYQKKWLRRYQTLNKTWFRGWYNPNIIYAFFNPHGALVLTKSLSGVPRFS